jgi:hypothetical protein
MQLWDTVYGIYEKLVAATHFKILFQHLPGMSDRGEKLGQNGK